MSYRSGFAHGERRAFYDRRLGLQLRKPDEAPKTPQEQGFWDAYTPRSTDWPQPIAPARVSEGA